MANTLGMGLQAGTQALRFGWYWSLKQALALQTSRLGRPQSYTALRPVPSDREILADLGRLFLRDASGVRDGIFPPLAEPDGPLELLRRARAMLADAPEAFRRQQERETGSVREAGPPADLPAYFTQDFHYQTGGYLTEQSARLYDVQVETLFLGGAAPMRREALRPIHAFLERRDQRRVALLDVACGTGRFLRDVRLTWPALRLTGLDLSASYLAEARRQMGDLRPPLWIAGNGEQIPLPDASQDIVTTIFLFHELPPDVRRRVAAEMARVLKPGGILVFVDSLQMGDRPGWDGLLEAFPVRFHEPYFRHFVIDDLDALLTEAGLPGEMQWTSFLSKGLVRRKR